MKGIRAIISIAAILLISSLVQAASLQFNSGAVSISDDGRTVRYEGLPLIALGSMYLPAQHQLVPLATAQTSSSLTIDSGNSTLIGALSNEMNWRDIPTSLDDAEGPSPTERSGDHPGSKPVWIIGETTLNGQRYAEILVFPITIDSLGQLWLHTFVQVSLIGQSPQSVNLVLVGDPKNSPTSAIQRSTSTVSAPEYLIVTSALLAESCQRLAAYKNETGFRTQIVLIDSILAISSGVDKAEKLRNYLKTFYAEGGQYVLLGGDETVVPVRYAYNLMADSLPSLGDMQICDLYFADLTGDWDRDHDGVYGERIQDAADITPELMVGRLPFRRADQVDRYVDKLIRYETDPGHGDPSYLTRSFFFSADQMRDWTPTPQHIAIASSFPAGFQLDTVSGVEATRGDDPSPINSTPHQLRPILSSGFGIVNIVAHGRDDGFAVRTAGYNENPKLYLISAPQSGESDCFDSTQAAGKPAFYYSLACNSAAFDYDQPPFNSLGICFATNVLSETDGAVGFVGYSRWGWVGTSYLLQKSFFDSLFAHPDRPAVAAMYASKAAFGYYRDLVYGQNFLGDPTLRVYCGRPENQMISALPVANGVDVTVSASGSPSAGCEVTLSAGGQIVARSITDPLGHAHFDLTGTGSAWVISATKPGSLVSRSTFSNSIVTGVNDLQTTPHSFSLGQNFPNPFNPSTHIRFGLPGRSDVRLVVIDILGREVKTVVDAVLPAGEHEVVWDGTDRTGRTAATGIYFYRLTAGSFQQTRRMLLLK